MLQFVVVFFYFKKKFQFKHQLHNEWHDTARMSSKCFSERFAPDKKIALWGHVLSETIFFLLSPPFRSPSVCGFPKSKMKIKGFLFWEVVIIFFLNIWCRAPLHRSALRDFSWQCAGQCCRDAGLTLALTHFILFIFYI